MRFTYFPVMLIALYSLTSGQESLRKHADVIGLNIGVAMGSHMVSDQSTSERCPIELFNIAGAKIFSCIVPTNLPFSLSSIAIPSGTTLVKANDQVLRVNLVR